MYKHILPEDYTKLEKIEIKHEKYLKYVKWIENLVVVIFAIVVITTLILQNLFEDMIFTLTFFAFAYSFLLGAAFLTRIYRKKARSNRLTPNQATVYYAGKILKNISDFSSKVVKENKELRKECKESTIHFIEKLDSVIEKNWIADNFPLGKEYGDLVEKFKRNFNERLVPTVKIWNEKTVVAEIEPIMYNFLVFVTNPTKDALGSINQRIYDQFKKDSTEYRKKSAFLSRAYHHHVGKHIIWMGSIFIFSTILFFIRVFCLEVLPDDALTFSVTIGVMLLVGYFAVPAVTKIRSE